MNQKNLHPDLVQNKKQFIQFLGSLIQDLKTNPADWGNNNLMDFLTGIKSWVEDMDGYYVNNKLEIPTSVDWKFLANVLTAAKFYE